jgi:hypothetical protein
LADADLSSRAFVWQTRYDLERLRREMVDETDAIPTLPAV